MTQSHQVVAYGYEAEGDAMTFRIYDPNWPARDDVTVSVVAVADWPSRPARPW